MGDTTAWGMPYPEPDDDNDTAYWVKTLAESIGSELPRQFPQLVGHAGALVGSPPAVGTGRFRLQAGVFTGNTDATGHLSIPLPSAFASGLLVALVVPAGGYNGYAQLGAGTTKAQLDVFCLNSSTAGAANVSGVKLAWVALGW